MKRLILTLALLFAAPSFATVYDTSLGRATFTGVNGSQTVFTFSYPVSNLAEIVVTVTGGTAGTATVTLNANQITSPGGIVTFATAPTAGATVKVERDQQLTQTLSISPYFPFPARSIELNYDRTIEQIQQVQRNLNDIVAQMGGSGVSSIGLSMPGIFTVSGSPLITPGTISVSLASESAHTVFAAPIAGGTPTFRLLDPSDLPLGRCNVNYSPYLADPTGVGDSTSAINNALLDANCVVIYIPKGTYSTNNSINMKQFKTIKGDGPESTVINYSGAGFALIRDSVEATTTQDIRINTSNIGANVGGILDANTTGPNIRNVTRNVQVWSIQNPPVATQYGIYQHSTTGFSLYYNQYDHVDLNLWGKAVFCLGEAGSGGCNANKWIDPEINASTMGFDFQGLADGLANANTVYGLHCNGAGAPFDQTCLNVGDAGNHNAGGNYVDLYADNAVGGHAGKSWQIVSGSARNKIVSFTSGNTAGTNGNPTASDRNNTLELNAISGRTDFRIGNVQLLADAALGGIYISPTSGNPAIFQSNATNVANNVAAIFKSNTQLASAGDILWAWQNNSGFTNSSNLHGGAGTNAAGVDLNGAIRQAGQTFANLNNPGIPPEGTHQFCSDCTASNICAAGGLGAMAVREAGRWSCGSTNGDGVIGQAASGSNLFGVIGFGDNVGAGTGGGGAFTSANNTGAAVALASTQLGTTHGHLSMNSITSDPSSPANGEWWVTGSNVTAAKIRMNGANNSILTTGTTNSAIQTFRAAGCATAAPINSCCTTTITWTTAFANTNYTATCTGNGAAAGVPWLLGLTGKSASQITVQTCNFTGAIAQYTALECVAIHD